MSTENLAEIRFSPDLIQRYDRAGPRYTSYPTAVQFQGGFSVADYEAEVVRSNAAGGPLSLYVHIPFCDTVCFYCACNKVVTKDRGRSPPYLGRLERELALQAGRFDLDRPVTQLHLGGGTPTFFNDDEMARLLAAIRRHFHLVGDDEGEFSIEIDPREASRERMRQLRELGFNRVSLGVQDFDPEVQRAVNRVQSFEQTAEVVAAAREFGFRGVSIDLIYGLPKQDRARFLATLERVLTLDPDRLAIFNYAHLPERFKPQRRIHTEELPSPAEKLGILGASIEFLTGRGYVLVGMDHFAKPTDPLAEALRAGQLQRNFQGYATQAEADMIGIGVSAIGRIGRCYAQNARELEDYEARIDAGQLAIERGVLLSRDDELRRALIQRLMGSFELDTTAFAQEWGIEFADYFRDALAQLAPMRSDGLWDWQGQRLVVLPAGKLLIRVLAMCFDAYLGAGTAGRFSRVI